MLDEILKEERDAAAEKLTGICKVYTSTLEAARALEAGDPVAIVPDPAFTMESADIATVTVELFAIYPSLDETAARDFFSKIITALLPFERADPQMIDIGEDQFFAYRITNTNTYYV